MYSYFGVSFPLEQITDPDITGPILLISCSSKGYTKIKLKDIYIPIFFVKLKFIQEIFTCSASDFKISMTCGSNKPPKKSVASLGNWVGILSIEQIRTPGP